MSLTEAIRAEAAKYKTEIAQKLVAHALEGSPSAMAELLNRVEGRVAQTVELPGQGDLSLPAMMEWLDTLPSTDD